MTTPKFCPQCGAALLPGSSNGICPRCAFQVALDFGERGGVDPTLQAAGRSEGRFVPPKPDQLAQHFPQLEILDLIGQGGMGAVYKARQRGLDRLVAVKILPPDLARDPAFEQRFGREARALAKLGHPNIVAVFDSGQAGGLFFFIMEYVDGVNLRQAIQAGQLSAKAALAIVPQVCDALQYAHDEGIVHRDIKPENVLIDAKGRVKIADFGLARLLGKTAENFTLTGAQQVMGTPRYMAPEQLEGTHDVDHRADIYSLGVIFYEMLTGELPLGRFAAPSKKVQIDVRLDEVVLRTLEKEPDLRYQQAGDVKTAVQTIVGPTSMPLHLQRMYGRDYRSRLQFFGLPLVHIATGINPVTNQRRIAKGIIAIGDQAIGVLAIGGVACGLIAIGGMAIGGITLGGLSIGLTLAIGGGAIGCGAAFGGFALAPVAVGGCAIGYYAAGGAGFGIHSFAGNARDAAGEAFFSGPGGVLLRVAPFVGRASLLVAFPVLLFSIVKAIAAMVRGLQGTDPRPATRESDPAMGRSVGEGFAFGCFAVLALILLGAVPLGLLVLTYFRMASKQTAAVQREEAAGRVGEARALSLPQTKILKSRQANLDWTDEGPAISDQLHQLLKLDIDRKPLDIDRRAEINQVLRETYREYLEIEKIHSKREVIAAHQTITIQVPAAEYTKLQQKLWSRLDALLNSDQEGIMRRLLPVTAVIRSESAPVYSVDDFVMPGVLGWGAAETQIDLFKGGEWFEWKITSQGLHIVGNSHGLDPRWKRFWVESPSSLPMPNAEAPDLKPDQ